MGAIEDIERIIEKKKALLKGAKGNESLTKALNVEIDANQKRRDKIAEILKNRKNGAGSSDVSTMKAAAAKKYIRSIEDYDALLVAREQEEGRSDGGRSSVLEAIDAAEEEFE